MISDEQLEALASHLFEAVQQSFREQGARRGLILKLPFNKQPSVIRQGYKDAAFAAYEYILGERMQQEQGAGR